MTPETFYSNMQERTAEELHKYVRFMTRIGCEVYGIGRTPTETPTMETPRAELLVVTKNFNKLLAKDFLPGKSVVAVVKDLNAVLVKKGLTAIKETPEGIAELRKIAMSMYQSRNSDDPSNNSLYAQQATKTYFNLKNITVGTTQKTGKGLTIREWFAQSHEQETLEARIEETLLRIAFTNEEPTSIQPERERTRLT